MRLFDRLFTRRRQQPRFADLSDRARGRLAVACRELTDAEDWMAEQLGLGRPPGLLLVDEEEAVVLSPRDREVTTNPERPA